jgi:hypothetical protein
LLERLGSLGIEPIGAIDRAPNLVEKRIWEPEVIELEDEGATAAAAG